jgi:outer membrane immunogenic protein
MKHLLFVTLAITALGSVGASAADLSRPAYKAAPVMMAPPPTWTGCYLGGNLGGAFGHGSVTFTNSGNVASGDNSGFAGGFQVGCDYEFNGGFVVGVRNLLDYTSLSSSGTGPGGNVVNFNAQWFDTLTARLGYAVMPNALIYLQGGAAWSHTSANVTNGGIQIGQVSNTRSGWTIGGGFEYAFAPNWSAFLEYNYMGFDSGAYSLTGACALNCPVSFRTNEQTILVGVNYRFHL